MFHYYFELTMSYRK